MDGKYKAFQPAANLTEPQVTSIERYLDAVRSNLLFAKSVLLVEGDAEEILIPDLTKKVLGLSLDELGVSLVNIRSTGFENVALLFHDDRISKKCAIITDLDSPFFDITIAQGDTEEEVKNKNSARRSAESGAARKILLDEFCENNVWVEAFYASHTLEIDLLVSGNSEAFVSAVDDVYVDPATIQTAKQQLQSDDIADSGKRILTMANNQGKGWFAIKMGEHFNHNSKIPDYILDAVVFAHHSFDDEVIVKILSYRIACIEGDLARNRDFVDKTHGQEQKWYDDWDNYITTRLEAIPALREKLSHFELGVVDLEEIKNILQTSFPENTINHFLRRF